MKVSVGFHQILVAMVAIGILGAGTVVVGSGVTAGQTAPGPMPVVTNLQAPTAATSGTQITVVATIRNLGSSTANPKIDYRFDGRTLVTKSRSLNAGGSDTVTFNVRVPDVTSGTYTHGIFIGGTDNGQTAQIRVDQPQPTVFISEWRGPTSGSPGDQVTVEATVVNTGQASAQTRVQYRVSGEAVTEQAVSVDAGAARTVILTVTLPDLDPGTYRHGVFIGDSETGQTRSLLLEGASQFHLTNLDAPTEAEVGERISVAATVTNSGTARGTTEVQYRIGGNVVTSQVVEVGSGQNKRLVFSFVVPELASGAYTQGVFIGDTEVGQAGSIEIIDTSTPTSTETATPVEVRNPTPTEAPPETTQQPTSTPTQSPTQTPGGLAGFGIVVALLGLLLALGMALRQKRV